MTLPTPIASPETVAEACEICTLNPPAEAILAGALFGEAAQTIRSLMANPNVGAFNLGARAMRDEAEQRIRDFGNHIAASCIADLPLPTFAPPEPREPLGWRWWSGSNDEWYTNGPFGSREDAVKALDGAGGFVIEAIKRPVQFSACNLIESQYFEDENYFSGEAGEPDRNGGTDIVLAADAELQALLDAWADRWRHTFEEPEMFAATRNGEAISADPDVAWKAAFVRRWVDLTGSYDGAHDAANAAWESRDVNGADVSPEECAEADVAYSREDAR